MLIPVLGKVVVGDKVGMGDLADKVVVSVPGDMGGKVLDLANLKRGRGAHVNRIFNTQRCVP